eukprot:PhM_4_TR16759/c0_g1_i2/m.26587
MLRFVTILIAAFMWIACCNVAVANASATISTVTPNRGSINGETRVSILGTGFDIRGRSNDVFIGEGTEGVFCDPIPNECHDTRIVCLMPAVSTLRGWYPLTVRSFGLAAECKISSGCKFMFTPDATPTVTRIIPEWMTAPDTITVQGSGFTNGDTTVGRFDFTMHIGDEERCQLVNDISSSRFLCAVEPMYAGTHKLDVIMGDSGRASWSGKTNLVMYPEVRGVVPASGSRMGGQLVTVQGSGFSRDPTSNTVTIHGLPCTVTRYLDEGVECLTSPAAATTPLTAATAIGGAASPWRAGVLRRDLWLGISGLNVADDLVGRLEFNEPMQTDYTTSGLEYPKNMCELCGTRFTGWFRANETGTHLFYLLGDDQASLWLSDSEAPKLFRKTAHLDVDPFNEYMIASVPSATNSFTTYTSQTSKEISLVQGKYYWLAIYLKEQTGSDYVDVEVTHPSGKRTKLTGDYVAYRDAYVPAVQAEVAGLAAKHSEGCLVAGGPCDFQYAAAETPVIRSSTPATATQGTVLTISGERLPTTCALLVVTTGSETCTVQSCSATEVKCAVSSDAAAGTQPVRVSVVGTGAAEGTLEVTVEVRVTGMTPSQGSVAGGSTLTITGSGFNAAANKTTVTVGGQTCSISKITGSNIECLASASTNLTGNTTSDVKIHVSSDESAMLSSAFGFSSRYVRPGITSNPPADAVTPVSASSAGGAVLTITGASLTGTYKKSDVRVSVGSSTCTVLVSLPQLLKCTVAASNPGQADIVVRVASSSTASTTPPLLTLTSAFTFVAVAGTINPRSGGKVRVSPYGGVDLVIDGITPKDASTVIVKLGSTALSTTVSGNTYTSVVPIQSAVSSGTASSLFTENFDQSKALSHFFYSNDVRKDSSSSGKVLIPSGTNWVMTKQSFTRPFSFSASIQPNGATSDCITLRMLSPDQGSKWQGYTLSVYPETKKVQYGVGTWVRTSDPITDMPTITSGSRLTWRVDIGNDYITLYINDVNVFSFDNTAHVSGPVGVGYSCQDVIVDDFAVKDLKGTGTTLTVSVDGQPLQQLDQDLTYTTSVAPAIVSMSSSSVVAGDLVTIMGKNFDKDNSGANNVFVLASGSTNAADKSSPAFCSEITRVIDLSALGQGVGVVCKVADVPVGTQKVRVLTGFGLNDPANTQTVTVKTNVVSSFPATSGAQGNIVTISGSGFPLDKAAIWITLGNADCPIELVSRSVITCRAPAMADGTYPISLSLNGVTFSNSTWLITYSAASTPTVTSWTVNDGYLDIKGSNFVASYVDVKIGSTDCPYEWGNTNSVRCRIQPGPVGSHTIYLRNEYGVAEVPSTIPKYEYKLSVSSVSPSTGSLLGGTELTLKGNGFVESWSSSGQLTWDFTSGSMQSGWSGTALGMTYCPRYGTMLGGYNLFGHGARITRSFTLPAHQRVRITLRVVAVDSWDTNEALQVHVDGHLVASKTESSSCSSDKECGRSDHNDCLINLDFAVAHSSTTLALSITSTLNQAANDESWGLLDYKIAYTTDGTSPYVVTVGGEPCPVTYADEATLRCATPPSNVTATTTTTTTHTANIVVTKSGGTSVPCDS